MKKNLMKLSVALIALSPTLAFAALDGIKGLLRDVKDILKLVSPIVAAIAFIYFFWGVGQFILNSGEQKARDEGKQKMLWGIIALFVIMSIYGILVFFGFAIGIDVDSSDPVTNILNAN